MLGCIGAKSAAAQAPSRVTVEGVLPVGTKESVARNVAQCMTAE